MASQRAPEQGLLDDILAEEGGKRLVPVGLGHDDQCIEDDFTVWRGLLWPELDQLLLDKDDMAVSTRYTAAISEYRVVFHGAADTRILDKSLSYTNGHAVVDAQHPHRADVDVKKELHTPEFNSYGFNLLNRKCQNLINYFDSGEDDPMQIEANGLTMMRGS